MILLNRWFIGDVFTISEPLCGFHKSLSSERPNANEVNFAQTSRLGSDLAAQLSGITSQQVALYCIVLHPLIILIFGCPGPWQLYTSWHIINRPHEGPQDRSQDWPYDQPHDWLHEQPSDKDQDHDFYHEQKVCCKLGLQDNFAFLWCFYFRQTNSIVFFFCCFVDLLSLNFFGGFTHGYIYSFQFLEQVPRTGADQEQGTKSEEEETHLVAASLYSLDKIYFENIFLKNNFYCFVFYPICKNRSLFLERLNLLHLSWMPQKS